MDDLAIVVGEELLDEGMVVPQQCVPAVRPELFGGLGRVGDVAQHQGDRAVWRTEATAEVRDHRLECGGDDIDRSELYSVFHVLVGWGGCSGRYLDRSPASQQNRTPP